VNVLKPPKPPKVFKKYYIQEVVGESNQLKQPFENSSTLKRSAMGVGILKN
jgi:hypothetical protein